MILLANYTTRIGMFVNYQSVYELWGLEG